MTARSYLSIGDVLTLLRQEFPDVTISKIRFLESQGLVDPERTPSGYRKFYQQDVDRLRWVLQQQRENFLPLKVIKDRLEEEPRPAPAAPAPAPRAAVRPEPVLVGQHAGGVAEHPGPGLRLGAESALPGMDRPGRGALGRPEGGGLAGARPEEADHPGSAPDPPEPSETAPRAPVAERDPDDGVGQGETVEARAEGAHAEASTSGTGGGPGDAPSGRAGGGAAGTGRGRSRAPRPGASGSAGGGRSSRSGSPRRRPASGMSSDEIAEASGLPAETVEELVAFGLLTPTVVAGFSTFDEADLSVARLAAQLARFGIEPRHLRLYKNAADREAGFVEQVVLPLLRQRNPDARERAESTAEELVCIGRDLRAALLQRSLASLLQR